MSTATDLWVRFTVAALDDPDFMLLSDSAKAVFFQGLLVARRRRTGGVLRLRELAFLVRKSEDETRDIVDELVEAGMLHPATDDDSWHIHAWSKYQTQVAGEPDYQSHGRLGAYKRHHPTHVANGETKPGCPYCTGEATWEGDPLPEPPDDDEPEDVEEEIIERVPALPPLKREPKPGSTSALTRRMLEGLDQLADKHEADPKKSVVDAYGATLQLIPTLTNAEGKNPQAHLTAHLLAYAVRRHRGEEPDRGFYSGINRVVGQVRDPLSIVKAIINTAHAPPKKSLLGLLSSVASDIEAEERQGKAA